MLGQGSRPGPPVPGRKWPRASQEGGGRMDLRWLVLAATGLALLSGPASAAPPGKIDRTIGKEPAYKSPPQYCLLLFGVESPLRVWLVLDGDTLYVDRNGSGDLTEKGKALVSKPQGVGSSFEVGAITDREGKTKHTNLHVGVMPEDKGQKRP